MEWYEILIGIRAWIIGLWLYSKYSGARRRNGRNR